MMHTIDANIWPTHNQLTSCHIPLNLKGIKPFPSSPNTDAAPAPTVAAAITKEPHSPKPQTRKNNCGVTFKVNVMANEIYKMKVFIMLGASHFEKIPLL